MNGSKDLTKANNRNLLFYLSIAKKKIKLHNMTLAHSVGAIYHCNHGTFVSQFETVCIYIFWFSEITSLKLLSVNLPNSHKKNTYWRIGVANNFRIRKELLIVSLPSRFLKFLLQVYYIIILNINIYYFSEQSLLSRE